MKWYLAIILVICSYPAYSQGLHSILDKSINPGEALIEFDSRTIIVEGTTYVFSDWQMGDIVLKSGINLADQWINYDLEFDQLEIKLEDAIKVVPIYKIINFTIKKAKENTCQFRPCSDYILGNVAPIVGICEVLDSNYFGLIIKYSSEIKESTYVPELDMGKKESEIIVTEKYFLTIGNNANPVPKKKQAFLELYGPHADNLKRFINDNKLRYKNKEDLHEILHFLNTDQ